MQVAKVRVGNLRVTCESAYFRLAKSVNNQV